MNNELRTIKIKPNQTRNPQYAIRGTQDDLICINKPNFQDVQTNVNLNLKRSYHRRRPRSHPQNKPNQTRYPNSTCPPRIKHRQLTFKFNQRLDDPITVSSHHIKRILGSFKLEPVSYHKINADFAGGYQINTFLSTLVLSSHIYNSDFFST